MILRNYIRFNAWSIIMVLFLAFSLSSCRDDNFDEPPINGNDPSLTVNMTIDSLKNIYKTPLTDYTNIPYIQITNDWTIKAVVIGDDKSGNLYKTMIVDDGTAGITIKIDNSNFNTDFPVGREVYVKLKGLVLSYYGGLVQLGGYKDTISATPSLGSIPSSLIRNYIVGGTWGHPVVTHTVTFADLGNDGKTANAFKWQSRLVTINKVQFQAADAEMPWANAAALASVNRYLECCYSFSSSVKSVIVRSSGYANFASQNTPLGSGTITGIYSVYNTDKQLVIRDLEDVQMDTVRFTSGACGSAPVPPPPAANPTSIANIRGQFTGTSTVVSGNWAISGVVISDATTNHTDYKNVIIQDGSAGILVRFDAGHPYLIGDSITVNCTGQTLYEYNGLLELGGSTSAPVPLNYSAKVGTGTISPRLVTVSDLTANMSGTTDTWESTLIKIVNASFSSATFGTTTNVTDATGTVLLYTRAAASFTGAAIPAGATSVTAIVSDFNGVQLSARSANDVQ